MGTIATLALVFVVWLAVRWVMTDGSKRGRGPRVDLATGRIVGRVGGGWTRALLAAGAAYLLARWQDRRQDRRDLVRRAEVMPENMVACRRCGQPITDDPIAGWIGPRGSGRCVGQAPHSPERALMAGR